MKKLAIVTIVLLLAAAVGFGVWRRGAGGPGDAAKSSSTAVSDITTAPPAAFDQAQQRVVSASTAWTELVEASTSETLSRSQKSSRVSHMLDEVDRAGAALPRDAFEAAAVVAAVGRDRGKLFEWVRDRTAFVPYDGALRGPVGVLMDRLGNSLDRALLMVLLLEKAGFEARLATGSLDDAAREKIMATFGARPRPSVPGMQSADALITRIAASAGLDDAKVRDQYAAMESARQALKKEAQSRVAVQTASLLAVVPREGTAPAPAISEHWWAQVEQEGEWIDLDPTLAAAMPGEKLVQAAQTLPAAELGDDRRHTLVIRVMGEVWKDGQRSDEVLLEHEFAPSQFFGQRIAFTNLPIDWPKDDDIVKAEKPADAVRKALVAQVEWLPILQIGSGVVVKQSVDDHGQLHDNTSPDANTMRLGRNVARVTQQALTGAMDLFSQLPSGDEAKAEPKPVRADIVGFTREWIDFELKAPGRESVRGTRTIFDSLTPGQRTSGSRGPTTDAERVTRGLALVGETELMPLYADLHPAFTADLIATRLQKARPVLEAIAAAGGKTLPEAVRNQLNALEPLPSALYAVAHARFSWSTPPGLVFLDRLNLVAQRSEIRDKGAGSVTKHVAIDFIANGVGVWAKGNAFDVRVAQGVADTVVESAALPMCATPAEGCQRGDNTSEAYAASDARRWVVSRRPGAAAPGIGASAGSMVNADLMAGYAVVSPGSELHAGPRPVATWWRVHPATGETLGMSVDGGSVSAETIIKIMAVGLQMISCITLWNAGAETGTLREARMIGCALAVTASLSLVPLMLAGEVLGAWGAGIALVGTAISMDWTSILGL